jgi:hypothetical protein
MSIFTNVINLEMEYENSSLLCKVRWEQPQEDAGTLYLTFKNGNVVYKYYDFSLDALKYFISSESLGQHFHAHIKDKYKSERV